MNERRAMTLPLLLLLLLAAQPAAADVKLYLKEGGHHAVREFEVKGDRVRFYSTERGDWEEMPLELIDLKKTQAEQRRLSVYAEEQKKGDAAERDAERTQKREVARIPEDAGVYWIDGANVIALQASDVKVVGDKRRSILKAVTPIPIVAGKSTLEIDGKTSQRPIARQTPELYLRITQPERFTIVRLARGKEGTSRIVERWSVVPISKELVQEHDEVDVFRHQVAEDVYKVWPQKSMPPGEYAFIQYTDGKGNVQVWDFTVLGEAPKP
jgi:hypothetical protein